MTRCSVRLSVCRLSVYTYVLWLNDTSYRKTVEKKQIGLPDCYLVVPIWTPYDLHSSQTGALTAPRNTCIANCGQTASVSGMVTIDSI